MPEPSSSTEPFRPTARVSTLGSVWLFDERAKEYVRMPHTERPRDSPPGEDWSAGVLRDLVRHPYIVWSVVEHGRMVSVTHADGTTTAHMSENRLIISIPDANPILAPCATVMYT